MKVALSIIGILICLLGLSWLVQGNDFFLYKVFAPKYENVRRQTFENTKSYNQGMIQELENMQFEYTRADTNHQAALASIILHRAADYPAERLPYELRCFITDLRSKQSR